MDLKGTSVNMSRRSLDSNINLFERVPAVEYARRVIRERDDDTMNDLLELVQIPAPTMREGERASHFMERCREAGLIEPYLDEVGNVLARLPRGGSAGHSSDDGGDQPTGGSGTASPVLLAAHLDTVFPAETDLRPRREGARHLAPGISDNTRGLVALLALARALVEAGLETVRPVVFVGTVGEEGVGDLRGVKHLFRDGSPWRDAAAFIAVDGTGRRRIVNKAIGSRRLRVELSGPGGHSWADWGRVNPIHAMCQAISGLAGLVAPGNPRTTLTVGRVGGGTSVNTIPEEAWFELDLRSEDAGALADLESRARHLIEIAVREAVRARRTGTPTLEARIEVIGDRPAGTTPADSPLVTAAKAATRSIGEVPELVASSTDANVPISLGIPAIALGAGGRSGGAHTLGEWYDNEGGTAGLERLLLTLVAVAGIA